MNLLELCMVSQVALVVPPVIYGIASLFTMSDTVKVKAVIVWIHTQNLLSRTRPMRCYAGFMLFTLRTR